jgi:hypothetical protein
MNRNYRKALMHVERALELSNHRLAGFGKPQTDTEICSINCEASLRSSIKENLLEAIELSNLKEFPSLHSQRGLCETCLRDIHRDDKIMEMAVLKCDMGNQSSYRIALDVIEKRFRRQWNDAIEEIRELARFKNLTDDENINHLIKILELRIRNSA